MMTTSTVDGTLSSTIPTQKNTRPFGRLRQWRYVKRRDRQNKRILRAFTGLLYVHAVIWGGWEGLYNLSSLPCWTIRATCRLFAAAGQGYIYLPPWAYL